VQAWLIFALEINWDEFLYLSLIYDYQRGDLAKSLQVFQVLLLGWTTLVPGNEVDQILVGRLFMLVVVTGTSALIYALARSFFDRIASLAAALAFSSAGFTIVHGASFRADPLAAFLIMLSLTAMARGDRRHAPMLLAGTAAAVAALVTIKVALYAPAFTGIAAWRLCTATDRRVMLKWLAGIAITAATAFALLYGLQLALIDHASNANSQAMLGRAARVQFLEYGVLPRRAEIVRAALLSPVQTILVLAGAIGVLVALLRGRTGERWPSLAIAGCGATLLCLLIYRNAFPYFFAFIFPPATLLIAWAVDNNELLKRRIGAVFLALVMLVPAILVAKAWSERVMPPQREVVDAVHEIFRQPVPMIDHSHMVGSFPKRGFFMSTWGMAGYRARPPIFANILQRETVPLLLLDSPRLAEAVGARQAMDPSDRLHDEDRTILRENYVRHWGPIWVAGKRLDPSGSPRRFEIRIPGEYTLEGEAMLIDDKRVAGGGVVRLNRGPHRFEAQSQLPRILRWGDHLYRPAGPEPNGPLFVGF